MTSTTDRETGGLPSLPAVILFFCLLVLALLPAAPAMCEDRLDDSMKELASKKEKVTIQAESLAYDRKARTYTATGSVRISQGETVLTADSATLNEETGEAQARGKAQLVNPANVLFADALRFNFNTKLGVIEKGYITVFKENYHITGERLERVGENEYIVSKGTLTSCDAVNPFWLATADTLNVRMDRDVIGRGVIFRIKGIPVLYTPYAWFPLLKPRTSGFLIPGVGYSTRQGARLFTSYYWAPLDNFDTTLGLDYRSKRGLGIADEIRLALDEDTLTNFYGYYMDDRLENKVRYNITLRHRQTFTKTVSGRLDLSLSDRQFYRELAETTQERTLRSKDSNAFLTDNWGWGRAYFSGQYTEGLDLLNSNVIVQRLPEIGANVLKKQVFDLPVYIDADVAGAYFYKKKGVTGERADGFLKASTFFNMGGVNISPRIGYRETGYDLHGKESPNFGEDRGLFGAGIKMQTGLYRLFAFTEGPLEGIRHTLEPLVAYNYVLQRGGRDLPKFDEVDTYGRRNQLAYSIVNRFVIKFRESKRLDFLTVKLNQFYDFHEDSVLTGSSRSFSPLYGEIIYEAGKNIKINNNFRYDFYKGGILSVNNEVIYKDALDRWHVAIGQRYSTDTGQLFMSPSRFDFFTPGTEFISDFIVTPRTKEEDSVNFLTLEGGARINQYWAVSGKVWYDVHTDNFRETDLSLSYSSQCWSVTGNYINRPGERQIVVLFNLKGLGNIKL